MPEAPVYQFIATSPGQTRTTRELQRAVRSHAASVSRPDLVIRRRTHTPKLGQGESVIVFNTEPAAPIERNDHGISPLVGTAAHINDLALVSETDQSDLDLSWNTSSDRLFIDILSGQTFSPISHLATFRKPYLPGIINHYIYNLTIPTPEIDGSSTSPHFRATWVPLVIHDPLIFQVVVLFAATHYATFADPSYYDHLSQELLSLKQSALSALIHRVQDEQSIPAYPPASSVAERTFNGCSDTLIAASAKMASYEAIFGSVQAVSLI